MTATSTLVGVVILCVGLVILCVGVVILCVGLVILCVPRLSEDGSPLPKHVEVILTMYFALLFVFYFIFKCICWSVY